MPKSILMNLGRTQSPNIYFFMFTLSSGFGDATLSLVSLIHIFSRLAEELACCVPDDGFNWHFVRLQLVNG